MDALTKLKDIGFDNASILNEEQGLVRIRTSKGWTYERFQTEDQIDVWARDHKPEVTE